MTADSKEDAAKAPLNEQNDDSQDKQETPLNEQEDGGEQNEETKDDERTTEEVNDDDEKPKALPTRPIKRARTAYFLFAQDRRPDLQAAHPGEGVAAIAKLLGQEWSSLPDDKKTHYQKLAAEERERVAKEMAAWKLEAADEILHGDAKPKVPDSLTFPIAKVRKIVKLDPDVKVANKEAVVLIAKAAELALAKLGQHSVTVAALQNRRKLLPDDVATVCATRPMFNFLQDDVRDLMQQQQQVSAEAKSESAKNAPVASTPPSHTKPLTSYFSAVPK